MGKHCQLVIGPAGSGKSTYCHTIQQHCQTIGRTVHCINLDPAAESYEYNCVIDIRDLISLDDVTTELQLGPNGGLIYCIEYLCNNLEWLDELIHEYNDDYIIIDCPGQIELYSHLQHFNKLITYFQQSNYTICTISLIDSLLITDTQRFISGILMCLSFMCQFELPHISVLSKSDLVDHRLIDKFLDPDISILLSDLMTNTNRYNKLTNSILSLIEQYNIVSFVSLSIYDDNSVDILLQHIDNAIQYGEDVEPKEPDDQVVDTADMLG